MGDLLKHKAALRFPPGTAKSIKHTDFFALPLEFEAKKG